MAKNTSGNGESENDVFCVQGIVTTTDTGEYKNTIEDSGTNNSLKKDPDNINQSRRETNGGIEEPVGIDKDKRKGLKRLVETLENLRGHISTAWNNAMVWVNDELVFTKLNTLVYRIDV